MSDDTQTRADALFHMRTNGLWVFMPKDMTNNEVIFSREGHDEEETMPLDEWLGMRIYQ